MSARQSAMRGPVGAGKNSQEAETQPRHNIPAGEPGKRTLEHGTPRGAPVVPPECETRCGMRGVAGGRQGRTSGLLHRPRGGYLYTRDVTTFFHATFTAHSEVRAEQLSWLSRVPGIFFSVGPSGRARRSFATSMPTKHGISTIGTPVCPTLPIRAHGHQTPVRA